MGGLTRTSGSSNTHVKPNRYQFTLRHEIFRALREMTRCDIACAMIRDTPGCVPVTPKYRKDTDAEERDKIKLAEFLRQHCVTQYTVQPPKWTSAVPSSIDGRFWKSESPRFLLERPLSMVLANSITSLADEMQVRHLESACAKVYSVC